MEWVGGGGRRGQGGYCHRHHINQSCNQGQLAVNWSRQFLGVGQMVKSVLCWVTPKVYWMLDQEYRHDKAFYTCAVNLKSEGPGQNFGMVKRSRQFKKSSQLHLWTRYLSNKGIPGRNYYLEETIISISNHLIRIMSATNRAF